MAAISQIAIAALLFVCAPPAFAQLPAPPVVGTGPIQLGGYASLTLSRPEHPETAEGVEVSELAAALMAWGQISPRTSYLVELDMAKRTSDTWTGREADQRLVPERMYVEYTAAELLRFRVGRFLTPVGQWNERHAEPLTWTPTRPLTTYRPFAKSLSGVLVGGEGTLTGRDIGYALYWAPSLDVDGDLDEAEENAFVNALGARVAAVVRPGLTLGVSAGRLRQSRPEEVEPPGETDGVGEGREEDEGGRALVSADLRWVTRGVELSAEATALAPAEGEPREEGAYVMAAVRLYGPIWAVTRGETYRPVDGRSLRVGFAGLTLRANRYLVAKLGRQFSQHPSIRIPDGWFVSFSSLF